MRWFLRLCYLAALGYFGFIVLACSLQRSMTYFPQKDTLDGLGPRARAGGLEEWRDAGGEFIGWKTSGGLDGRPVVVLHGNAGNALNRNVLAARIRDADPDRRVYLLEYPGFGARSGSPSQSSLVAAAIEALDNLPTGAKAVIVGESLGTGVAAQVAAQSADRVSGLILLTPFDSLVSVAKLHYPWIPVGILMSDRFDSVAALRDFAGPVAFILAGEDTMTPKTLGMRLHDAFRGERRLVVLDKAGHNEVINHLSPQDWRGLLDFASGRSG